VLERRLITKAVWIDYEKAGTLVPAFSFGEVGAMRIDIAAGLSIDEAELDISFITAGGPGGQNVNKVASAAQLRFDARQSLSLPNEVKVRLQALAGTRLTRDGVIVITARAHRTQERNRVEAVARLVELIRTAAVRPVRRRPTRPGIAAKERRLEAKSRRSGTKRDREKPDLN
jgi:ribosome-associated protein